MRHLAAVRLFRWPLDLSWLWQRRLQFRILLRLELCSALLELVQPVVGWLRNELDLRADVLLGAHAVALALLAALRVVLEQLLEPVCSVVERVLLLRAVSDPGIYAVLRLLADSLLERCVRGTSRGPCASAASESHSVVDISCRGV